VADAKRARKKQSRQARLAAEAAARRKAAQRRRLMFLAGGAVLLAIILAVVTSGDGKKTDVATTGSSTTQVPTPGTAAGSAAGKPCVALADPLPAGAPEVPVKVGPPPAELVKEDLKPGTGAEVKAGQTLTVNYIGVSCSTGKIFDSSYSRGQAATFPLSGVIKGWQDGIPGMKVGGQRLLGIPSAQAYGETGSPPSIAPDEPLWFVVDVLDAK
jgi:peptidylprolyl isomerase